MDVLPALRRNRGQNVRALEIVKINLPELPTGSKCVGRSPEFGRQIARLQTGMRFQGERTQAGRCQMSGPGERSTRPLRCQPSARPEARLRKRASCPGRPYARNYGHPAREGVMAKIGHGTRPTLRGPHLPHDVLELKRVSYE